MIKKNIKPKSDIILSAFLVPKPFRDRIEDGEDINSEEVQKLLKKAVKVK